MEKEENKNYDFFGYGERVAKEMYGNQDKIAKEIEQKYGSDARLEFECGVSIGMSDMYSKKARSYFPVNRSQKDIDNVTGISGMTKFPLKKKPIKIEREIFRPEVDGDTLDLQGVYDYLWDYWKSDTNYESFYINPSIKSSKFFEVADLLSCEDKPYHRDNCNIVASYLRKIESSIGGFDERKILYKFKKGDSLDQIRKWEIGNICKKKGKRASLRNDDIFILFDNIDEISEDDIYNSVLHFDRFLCNMDNIDKYNFEDYRVWHEEFIRYYLEQVLCVPKSKSRVVVPYVSKCWSDYLNLHNCKTTLDYLETNVSYKNNILECSTGFQLNINGRGTDLEPFNQKTIITFKEDGSYDTTTERIELKDLDGYSVELYGEEVNKLGKKLDTYYSNTKVEDKASDMVEAMANGTIDTNGNPITEESDRGPMGM